MTGMTVFQRASGSAGIWACATRAAGYTSSCVSNVPVQLIQLGPWVRVTHLQELDQLCKGLLRKRRHLVLNLHIPPPTELSSSVSVITNPAYSTHQSP